jgi:hypothetical protein
MPTLQDVRDFCQTLPGTEEGTGVQFSIGVRRGSKLKGFCWVWLERPPAGGTRQPNESVVGLRVPELQAKEAILSTNPEWFQTDPHYDNYPAVLVILAKVPLDELHAMLIEAWKCQVSPTVVKAFLQAAGR